MSRSDAGHDTHDTDQLPPYTAQLSAFNRSFADDMRRIVAALPIHATSVALDVACGDGAFCVWLAERAGSGHVTGLDRSKAYLDLARRNVADQPVSERITFQIGDGERLPFEDGSFDVVWCAHSLYSLPDPQATLREMRRVAREGGIVAVLENDTLHHLLLPLPAPIEMAVRQAQMDALRESGDDPDKFYVGRDLPRVLAESGLRNITRRTFTADRAAPLDADTRTFLTGYLGDMRDRAAPFLDRATNTQLDALLTPESDQYLLDQPGFWMSCLEICAWGVK